MAQTCPECGTRVSAFAAGCAVCGADLEAYARQRRLAEEREAALGGGGTERRFALPRIPDVPNLGLSPIDALLLAVAAFFALFVPVLGLLCAALGMMHGYYESRRGLFAAYAVLGVIAAALEIRAL
ncbi:MAG TPA: hypothetical protein VN238_16775 [Solirubrobacteraceae bacterium]|nr:hypothetical protein [Solirubrobacteraceae bacterium]